MKTPSPPRQVDAKSPTNGSQPGGAASGDKHGLAPERIAEGFSDAALLGADWFWEMDAELRYTFQSSGFEEITGLAATEVIGKTREEAFAGRIEDSESWRRQAEVLRRREDHSLLWTFRRPDGEIRLLRTLGKPVFDAWGRFQGYRGIGSDISEAASARRKIIESENRFRSIIENVTDIVALVGPSGRLRYLNDAVEKVLGYRVDELESHKDGAQAVPEDRKKISKALARVLSDPAQSVSGIYRYRHRDGSIRLLQMTRRRARNLDSRKRPAIILHARDITAQSKLEKALRQSEERLRDFAETCAEWFWEQDAELRFTYVAGDCPELDRMAIQGIIGKTREEIVPDTDFKAEHWQQLARQLEAREPFQNFEYAYPRPDGSEIVVRISGKPVFDEDGEFAGYRGTGIDVTESHLLSQQLNYQASHDPLTGLVNRREFEQRLARVIKSCREDSSEHALCYVDLDQFKVVNDTCGHDAGDELLRQISALLADKVRQRDTIARLGGDEFGLLLERCTLNQARRVGEAVRETVENFRFIWAGRSFRLGVSIGVIPIDFGSGNVANVMRSADAACYTAKDMGRNRIHVYREDSFETAQRQQEMERIVELNHAFDEQRFILYQQPIYSLSPGNDTRVRFCEVLVRMVDEAGFPVLPANFLPTAERYNLATQLDTWVVNATLDWMAADPEVHCTINLSGMSIADEDFLRFMLDVIDRKNVEASRICLEITETAAIQNLSKANRFIQQLRACGCFFALDDFGSGLSSFAYLKTLPVDFLKIDGFFVRDMVEDRINYELVKSINDVGHVMGKRTIAEFVENDATLQALRDTGVDYAQGFNIAKPEPVRM
jgi:diguanylate cyclase (GGDEF)-like protein/PAS domain S-box-containing protein